MSTTPDGPEYLDTEGPADPATGDDNRKRLLAVGGLVAAGALVAGGAWAATSFFATGAQPSEALPDSTIAYFSVDLDPSGGQKIEAIKTLRKFPAISDQLDLETDDDLRERFFQELTESGECADLDYASDVEPWLGSRAAVAAVDLGEDEPAAVGVVQVTDSGAAEDGIATLVEACGGEAEGESVDGWVVDGDWMVLAETREIAEQVVDAADGATLADDASFATWTGEAGGDGFMSIYVAKGVTKYAQDAADMGLLGSPFAMPGQPQTFGEPLVDEDCLATASPEDFEECFSETEAPDPSSSAEELPPELEQVLADFDGAAATVRFDDGGVEIEYAMSNTQQDMTEFVDGDAGLEMLGDLPEDTVAAMGFSLEEGWGDAMIDYVKTVLPEDAGDIDETIAQAEAETGLSIPEDFETLMGEGMTISLGGDIDPDAIANGGPGELPLGFTIKGDAGEIQAVLDKISAQAGPDVEPFLEVTEGDGYAVIALQDGYRTELESGGDLGGRDSYSKVVDGDAQTAFYVDFNASDDWLVRLTKDMPEVSENLEPLSAAAISGWVDDDVVHGKFKVTTD